MKLTKMLLLIAFVALFGFGSLFGQTLTGPAIPDSTAQRLYFLNLSNMDSPTRQAHLANNTGLSATDIPIATTAISDFKTSYSQAVAQYNATVVSVSGFSQGALSTFQSQQANTTAIAMGYLESRLSLAGYTALQAEIIKAKSTIKVPSTNSTMVMGATSSSMGCCYNTIASQTITVLSWSPRRETVTFTTTLEGNVPTFTYPGVVHQGTIYSHIGNEVGSVTGSWAAPNVYINLTTNVILDTNYDTCLADGYCTEVTTAAVHCSAINGGNQFTSSRFAQVEVAVTEGYWGGSPPPACSGDICIYKVVNNCTLPPDLNLGAVRSYNYVGTAYNLTWIAIAPCIRLNWPGPWSCGPALALKTGINTLPPPLYACTSNP